jgi:hypothetical protein
MALALTGGTIALLRPTVLDSVTMASYKTLGVLHEWRWFLTGPVLHFIVASALLLAGFRLLPPRLRAGVLVAGSAVELLWQFSLMVYRAPLDRQERRPPDYRVICSYGRRFFSLADFLAPGLLPMLADATRDGQTRWAAMPLEWDNFAWAADSRALLGHSSRPLLPRLVNVMNRFLQDMPYSPRYGGDMSRLFNNMSVGYVLTPDPPNPAAPWNVMAKAKIVLSEIPKPLPYVHTQDRVIALGAEAQLDRFCTTDLRRAVYVEPEVAAAVPQSADPRGGDIPAEERERFERLQQTNRILRVDQSRPNRTVIEAEIAKPAMLVITECWHPGWRAEVDGRRVPLWQVNYLQQGLWLEAGRHSVRLSFFPRSLRCGAWVSAGSAVIVAAVALWGMLRRGLAGGGADCCGSPAGTPKRSAPFAPSVIDRLPEEARVGR